MVKNGVEHRNLRTITVYNIYNFPDYDFEMTLGYTHVVIVGKEVTNQLNSGT